MTNRQGEVIWYELMTQDADRAAAFYGAVIGWQVGAAMPGGPDYRMIAAPDGNAGGMLQLDDAMRAAGASPTWLAYFGVDDVDASLAAIVDAGGTVLVPAWDAAGVGRIAMLTDPQGIPFYVMRGATEGATSTVYQRHGLGHVGWNELLTPDAEGALGFYHRHFGLTRMGGMPMGELGEYSFIGHDGGEPIGAIMPVPAGAKPGWGFYFRVDDVDHAKGRVEAAGGTVLNGPMDVPGGERVLQAVDPDGAVFGLVSGQEAAA
ncbi:VOC family protein [Sphingomonas sp. TDK1]|uniref:VOC family protein n=1 Tax=Sphingomonas sp. TDK1 TaxID=453247 RepID=UPI0007D9D10F|nr:VOC family protein [Sphingomonas sp. TDK1]OAN65685.1 bleomycin resistance protein [Sphingomonas sp. TDK1]